MQANYQLSTNTTAVEENNIPIRIINTHSHCFTIEHVPDYFVKRLFILYRLFPIRWIIKHQFIRTVIRWLDKKWLVNLLGLGSSIDRIRIFAEYFELGTQEKMINYLQSFYPKGTRLVLLTMDMEFMAAGKPASNFDQQLNELAKLKQNEKYKNLIYPFVFADPRRANVSGIVKENINSGLFQGIKIYPALGYYPFDKRLKEVYEFALEKNLPITTHCIKGVVYFRGSKKEAFGGAGTHPLSGQQLFGKKAEDYTLNFTHPLNFECLLNHELLKKLWGEDAPDLRNLKICLGHYGGDDEWMKYLTVPWLPNSYVDGGVFSPRDVDHPWFDPPKPKKLEEKRAYSWFSVISELMKKYPNVYADISYTLKNEAVFPMLKMVLTMPYYKDIRDRVLFGTDYFVVSKVGSDREMSIKIRTFLGESLFRKIAEENPQKFLNLG